MPTPKIKTCLHLAFALSVFCATHAQAETIKIGIPQNTATAASKALLSSAYKKLGREVEFIDLPAARALLDADHGEVDADIHRIEAIAPEHPNLIMVPVVIATHSHSAYVMRGSSLQKITPLNYEALRHAKIGYVRGYRAIALSTAGMDTIEVTNEEQLFKMLALGRVDVVVTTSIKSHVEKFELNKDVIELQPPLATIKLYHYIHKKHAELVPGLERELNALLKNPQ